MRDDDKLEVLVVEDEDGIRIGVCDVLAYKGYAPTGFGSGEEGLEAALTGAYALVLLDVMLPGIDGFQVCRQVRQALPDQAILMLTAKGSEEDILHGFSCGADDYVTKPFSVAQLMARAEALLRRVQPAVSATDAVFAFGGWQVEPEQRRARCDGAEVELTKREIEMLSLFAREQGRIISRRVLLREVWGMHNAENINTRTVDMHIAKLRKKIDAGRSSHIETVRGEGYRFLG